MIAKEEAGVVPGVSERNPARAKHEAATRDDRAPDLALPARAVARSVRGDQHGAWARAVGGQDQDGATESRNLEVGRGHGVLARRCRRSARSDWWGVSVR